MPRKKKQDQMSEEEMQDFLSPRNTRSESRDDTVRARRDPPREKLDSYDDTDEEYDADDGYDYEGEDYELDDDNRYDYDDETEYEEEPVLVAARRNYRGAPTKYVNNRLAETRTKVFMYAVLAVAAYGLFSIGLSLFSLLTQEPEEEIVIPVYPKWSQPAALQAEAFIEGRYNDMLPMPGGTTRVLAGLAEPGEDQDGNPIVREGNYPQVVDVRPVRQSRNNKDLTEQHTFLVTAITRNTARAGFSNTTEPSVYVYYEVEINLGDPQFRSTGDSRSVRLIDIPKAKPVNLAEDSVDNQCGETKTVSTRTEANEVLEKWAEAFLAGDNNKLYQLASEDDSDVFYPAFREGHNDPHLLVRVAGYRTPCLIGTSKDIRENVHTMIMQARSCSSGALLDLAVNIRTKALDLNPSVTGWAELGILPEEGGEDYSNQERPGGEPEACALTRDTVSANG